MKKLATRAIRAEAFLMEAFAFFCFVTWSEMNLLSQFMFSMCKSTQPSEFTNPILLPILAHLQLVNVNYLCLVLHIEIHNIALLLSFRKRENFRRG